MDRLFAPSLGQSLFCFWPSLPTPPLPLQAKVPMAARASSTVSVSLQLLLGWWARKSGLARH